MESDRTQNAAGNELNTQVPPPLPEVSEAEVYSDESSTATPPLYSDEEIGYYDYDDTDRSIRGWLAFFLWVGIGLGAIISIVSVFNDLDTIKKYVTLPSFLTVFTYFYIFGFASLAIYTIQAFYRHKPDAVASAAVYVGMVISDGIAGVLLGMQHGGMDFSYFKPIIWGVIWGLFLNQSTRVEAVIPPETRKFGLLQYAFIIIIAIGLIGFYVSLDSMISDVESATPRIY